MNMPVVFEIAMVQKRNFLDRFTARLLIAWRETAKICKFTEHQTSVAQPEKKPRER